VTPKTLKLCPKLGSPRERERGGAMAVVVAGGPHVVG